MLVIFVTRPCCDLIWQHSKAPCFSQFVSRRFCYKVFAVICVAQAGDFKCPLLPVGVNVILLCLVVTLGMAGLPYFLAYYAFLHILLLRAGNGCLQTQHGVFCSGLCFAKALLC
jgi:hypothetical protein